MPKRIVITDTHDRYKQTIISNSEYNILKPNEKGFNTAVPQGLSFFNLKKQYSLF